MIRLKTKEEIEILKEGGKKLAQIIEEVAKKVQPGVMTDELNDLAHEMAIEFGGKPAFLNYRPAGARRPFPSSLCVSINDEIVHGISTENPKEIKEGDLVKIDMGLIYKKLYTDHAITVPVGEVSKESRELVTRTKEALNAAIKKCHPGNHIGDIGYVIEKMAEKSNLSVVNDLAGHGVGYAVHENPYVPNTGESGTEELLEIGLVIAIEPMFCLGKPEIMLDGDGHTYKTRDGSLSAQFEHTVAITENGPLILTINK